MAEFQVKAANSFATPIVLAQHPKDDSTNAMTAGAQDRHGPVLVSVQSTPFEAEGAGAVCRRLAVDGYLLDSRSTAVDEPPAAVDCRQPPSPTLCFPTPLVRGLVVTCAVLCPLCQRGVWD